MTKHFRSPLAIAVAGLTLGACMTLDRPPPTVAPSKDAALDGFVSSRRQNARQMEAGGRLAAALREWRYLAAVAPGDRTAKREISRLQRLIDARAAAHLRRADAAWRKGNGRQARVLYLKVLALDGTNRRALDRLRGLEREAVLAGQARKDETALAEYRAKMSERPVAGPGPAATDGKVSVATATAGARGAGVPAGRRAKAKAPPEIPQAQSLTRTKIALARDSRKNGDLRGALNHLLAVAGRPDAEEAGVGKMAAELRKEIAAGLYADGLKQMNSDLDRAIELLAEALKFDPQHLGAHRRLRQAKTMRDRLKSIR